MISHILILTRYIAVISSNFNILFDTYIYVCVCSLHVMIYLIMYRHKTGKMVVGERNLNARMIPLLVVDDHQPAFEGDVEGFGPLLCGL